MKMKKYLIMMMLLSAGLVLTGWATVQVQAPPELVMAIQDGNISNIESIMEENLKLVDSKDEQGLAEQNKKAAEESKILAEQNRDAAEKAKAEETKQRQIAEQEQIKDTEAEKEAQNQAEVAKWRIKAEEELYVNQITSAQRAIERAETGAARNILTSCSDDMRNWEWYYLWNVSTAEFGFADLKTVFPTRYNNSPLGLYENFKLMNGALKKFEGHKSSVENVEFSSDGKYLFSMNVEIEISSYRTGEPVSHEKIESEIKIWDIESGKEIKQIKVPDSAIRNFCIAPKGDRIAMSTNKEAIITDLNGTILKKQQAHGKISYRDSSEIAWSPDGKYIAFETRIEYDNAGVIGIWDIDNDKIIHTIALKSKEGMNSTIRNSLSGSESDIYSLVFSPDSKSLAAGTNFSWNSNRTLRVWDVKTGKEQMLFGDQDCIITTLSFSPDGKYLADLRMIESWSGYKTIRIWDFEKGVVKHTLEGHTSGVYSVSYSPDGKRIATVSDDKTIRIWNSNTGKEVLNINFTPFLSAQVGPGVRFSPDGKSLAVWGLSSRENVIRILIASSEQDVAKWKANVNEKIQQKNEAKISEQQDADAEAEEFFNAIQTGDKSKLNDFLAKNETNSRFSAFYDKYSLFTVISEKGHPKTAELFIERGVNVNEKHPNSSNTALHEAVKQDSLEIVKLLIKNGADINAEGGWSEETPLHIAAEQGNKEIVEYLIESSAYLNPMAHFDTPLTLALKEGHLEVVKLLINKGAEVNVGRKDPLSYAKGKGYSEIASLIEKHGGVIFKIEADFFFAVKSGEIEQVGNILKEHPQLINSIIYSFGTPIFEAIRNGKIEMVRLLVSKGAKINILNSRGQAPIHYAADRGEKEILEILIENGANINIQTTKRLRTYIGCTPLHWAVLKGNKEIIDILLRNGADINIQTAYPEYTPLHLAVKSGNKDIVMFLLSKGADINMVDASRCTPSDYAKTDELKTLLELRGGLKTSDLLDAIKEENLGKIKEILRRIPSFAKAGTEFKSAIEKNNIQIVSLFLQAGFDVNGTIGQRNSPLEVALGYKINTEIAMLLIEHGANVNVLEEYSQETVLHKAIRKRDIELVRAIIQKGADTNRECLRLGSPLNMALTYMGGNKEIIQSLLENGADISGDKGIEYLGKAVERGNPEAVLLLLQNGVDIKNDKGRAIFQKAFQGNIEENIIKYLISYGADFKGTKNSFGQSILHYALRNRRGSKNLGNGIIFNIYSVETSSPDIDFVKALITKKADINVKDKYGNSPLYYAIRSKDIELIKTLIENGADVNAQDIQGNSPLSYAIRSKDIELIKTLIENGADVNTQNKYGYILLHGDIPWKHEKILGLLLNKGADINKPNNDGLTPLQNSVFYYPDIVQIIKTKGGTSQSALIDAIIKEDIENVKAQILLDPNEINLLDGAGNSLLHYATALQNYAIAEYLIDTGINVDTKSKKGITALQLAIDRNNVQILELILLNGANVNTHVSYGSTPLDRAIYIKDENVRTEVVRLLLKYKADINLKDGRGNTVLHKVRSEELTSLILSYNPDLTLKNADGLNPLELALKRNKLNIVKLIKQRGGSASDPVLNAIFNNDLNSIEMHLKKDPRLTYNSPLSNVSLIYLIAYFGDIETIGLISKYGNLTEFQGNQEKKDSLIHDLASLGKNEMIEELLKRGVGVDCLSRDGDTPLIYAALFGQKETVLLLIKNGADIHIKDKKNGTCLHAACRNGHDEIVRILVEGGAAINAKGQNDLTPLHLAANEGHEKVVKTLLEKGADPITKNNDNKTPLDLAKEHGHKEIVKLLSRDIK